MSLSSSVTALVSELAPALLAARWPANAAGARPRAVPPAPPRPGYQPNTGTPRMVYQVDTETGKETLVSGVDVVGTPSITITQLPAVGADAGVVNGTRRAESGMVPVSSVAPSTLSGAPALRRRERARAHVPPSPLSPIGGAR